MDSQGLFGERITRMATAALENRLQAKIVDYLQDAHAMESNILRMLDSMISTTNDPEVLHQLKRHRMDTERHEKMVRERLEALGQGTSLTAEVPAIMGAWLKGLADKVRADKPGKNARDGFITEHVEIAAYSLLEQLADRVGDLETARMARFIREDEEEMARWIASRWGKFIDLTLEEGGFELPRGRSLSGRWPYGQAQPRWGGRFMYRREQGRPVLRFLGWAAVLGVGGYLLARSLSTRSRTTTSQYPSGG
jgi:ferritin-like metal-binding protein YciE